MAAATPAPGQSNVGSGPVTSPEIVQQWAKLPGLPKRKDDLKALWAGSNQALSADWDAGAAELADGLTPYARNGQIIDQPFIKGLDPSTVEQLSKRLGW